jgi:hypothetical protein
MTPRKKALVPYPFPLLYLGSDDPARWTRAAALGQSKPSPFPAGRYVLPGRLSPMALGDTFPIGDARPLVPGGVR